MIWGTWMAASLQLKSSVYPLHIFGQTYAMYAAVPALLLNLAVSAGLTLVLRATHTNPGTDLTQAEDYA
jgi:SSS family solute:Na+ symporter